jgi:hypothetical protein
VIAVARVSTARLDEDISVEGVLADGPPARASLLKRWLESRGAAA